MSLRELPWQVHAPTLKTNAPNHSLLSRGRALECYSAHKQLRSEYAYNTLHQRIAPIIEQLLTRHMHSWWLGPASM